MSNHTHLLEGIDFIEKFTLVVVVPLLQVLHILLPLNLMGRDGFEVVGDGFLLIDHLVVPEEFLDVLHAKVDSLLVFLQLRFLSFALLDLVLDFLQRVGELAVQAEVLRPGQQVDVLAVYLVVSRLLILEVRCQLVQLGLVVLHNFKWDFSCVYSLELVMELLVLLQVHLDIFRGRRLGGSEERDHTLNHLAELRWVLHLEKLVKFLHRYLINFVFKFLQILSLALPVRLELDLVCRVGHQVLVDRSDLDFEALELVVVLLQMVRGLEQKKREVNYVLAGFQYSRNTSLLTV